MKNTERKSPFGTNMASFLADVATNRLGRTALHLYAAVLALLNARRWPGGVALSDRAMAAQVGMSTRGLKAAREELVAQGILLCRTQGTGNATKTTYSLAERRARTAATATEAVRPETATGATPECSAEHRNIEFITRKEGKEAKEERAKERAVPLAELAGELTGRRRWVEDFCRHNRMGEDELREWLARFVGRLSNQGVTHKEPDDAAAHFGAWFNRVEEARAAAGRSEREERTRMEDERRARAEAEDREREESKRRMEEEGKQRFRAMRAKIERDAARGDERAIEWMRKWKHVDVDE